MTPTTVTAAAPALAAGPLLDAHLDRLEHALADARRELSAARTLIDDEETTMTPTTVTAAAPALAAALRSVRFAAGSDPELPAITGVLLDVTPDGVWVVATDRYRLAIAPVDGARIEGGAARAVLPATWVDGILPLLGDAGDAIVTLRPDAVDAQAPGGSRGVAPLGYDYPDYRRLVRDHAGAVTVDPAALRAGIATAPLLEHRHERGTAQVALLRRDADTVVVPAEPGQGAVAFDRGFLLEAVDAAEVTDGAPLTLALDGPLEPLVLRTASGGVSLLMPIALG